LITGSICCQSRYLDGKEKHEKRKVKGDKKTKTKESKKRNLKDESKEKRKEQKRKEKEKEQNYWFKIPLEKRPFQEGLFFLKEFVNLLDCVCLRGQVLFS